MEKPLRQKKPKYCLWPSGEFVIENYGFAKPFANFFPGIAGKYGIPMWVFYVNRGQGIISFGTRDKDHSILEFFPANKAWQLASLMGFRTFLKIAGANKNLFYEPFHQGWANREFNLSNRMRISAAGLIIEEENLSLGLKIKVEYFNIPNDSYAGLARIITIRNLSPKTQSIQVVDGLPQIVPFGTSNLFLKKLGRTIEAWAKVENLKNNVPFFKLDVDPSDRPEVIHIKAGNFYLGFQGEKNKAQIIKPIVDPEDIFGPLTDFSLPEQFLAKQKFFAPKREFLSGKTPCAFLLLNLKLKRNEEKSFYALSGYAQDLASLNKIIPRIASSRYLAEKNEENKKIISDLQNDIATRSSSRAFDFYAKQTYLDNIIRGGYPVVFDSGGGKSVFYLYSRKHGDLERDYNKFLVQPTYFSQGNGNYRDVNQNRRCDIWFNPDIREENLYSFFNLIQADGFNPLVVKGLSFRLREGKRLKERLKGIADEKAIQEILLFLDKPFTPGELILFCEGKEIKLRASYDEFLGIVMAHAQKIQEAEHGEGFWIDHWTYNLDLLESYLGVYPEKLKEIVFEKKIFTYFDNSETVKPRCEKYFLKDGCVRQLHALAADSAKRELIRKRQSDAHLLRTDCGKGEICRTTLMNKLACLLVNKLSSLDPYGCGIEMEADRPNWYDALNGLPGLLGSSVCETFELKRLILFIKNALRESQATEIDLTQEIYEFLLGLDQLLEGYFKDSSDFLFWDNSHALKEAYRQKTRFGFSGKENSLDASRLQVILGRALKKAELGIERAFDKKNFTYCSYFYYEVSGYETIKDGLVKAKGFRQIRLPLFLEGQVHALRLSENPAKAKPLHQATRRSALYDQKLKMYKVTAPLGTMPEEIGRCRVFPPGWLENESIWLHMEYKYLLELLKCGLIAEFYQDFKNVLIPFQNPYRYGRNILENSSFLVSSAFGDHNLHGNGFVARLSGSTAEFLQIWLLMNAGKSPFFLNDKKELNLRFAPLLCGWLFDAKGDYSFNFLSKIRVAYHNPKRKNTYGKDAAKIKKIILSGGGSPQEILSETIPAPYAEQIRSRKVSQIDLYLD